MARYTYVTANDKVVQLDDYMFTEMGIEGIQVIEGKVVLVLILPDGSIMFDYESGKDADALKSAKEEYQAMAARQKDQFRERADEIIRQAVANGELQSEVQVDEDGEPIDDESQGPMLELPPLDKYPPGYA
jgi:hypothetical protein